MWSFVIGGSAIFVMTLSGNLIDIGQGTLVLLGITGIVAVGSKLQSHTETQSGGSGGSGNVPAVVGGLAVTPPATDCEIRLSWTIPTGAGAVDTYTVFYQQVGCPRDAWPVVCASRTVTKPRFAIVGLSPGTRYSIKVIAVNRAGAGPAPADPLVATTAAAAPLQAGAPGQVVGVTARPSATPAALDVAWTETAGATGYNRRVPHPDSDDLWTADPAAISAPETDTGCSPAAEQAL